MDMEMEEKNMVQ